MGQELASSLVGWCGPGRQKAEQACSLPRGWQGQEDLPQDGPPTGLWAQGLGVSPHGPPGRLPECLHNVAVGFPHSE